MGLHDLHAGFGNFYDVAPGERNPSARLVEALQACWHEIDLSKRSRLHSCEVLEVNAQVVLQRIEALAQELGDEQNVVWLHFGLDGTTASMKLERQAWNEASFRNPDEGGWQPWQTPIDKGNPLEHTLQTDLPLDAVLGALQLAGHRVKESLDPGRFVCNWTLYHSLMVAQQHAKQHWHSLFVHVPPLHCIDAEAQLKLGIELVRELILQLF